MKPLDQSAIRKQNIRNILDLLTLRSPRTRYSLAEATGLSLMTVTNLIDLLKAQQVLDISPVPRSLESRRASGRKAEHIALRGSRHAWLIADLSGVSFRYTLLGFDLSTLSEGSWTAEGAYLSRLDAFLQSLRDDLPALLAGRELTGVAIVTPGPYEVGSDTVHNQRLPELNGVRIKEKFRLLLGEYDYYVDEDVKFAVQAFSSLIEQRQCELLYYLYIGEGVGGASVHNGDLLRGLNATAGDAGRLTAPCGATYESLLSLSAFSASLNCAEEHPEDYLQALMKAADTAGDMLFAVLWILDPSHIIIDCRYALPFEDAFLQRISDTLSLRFAPSGRRLPVITAAPQGMSSVIRGAVQVLQREWIERILA